MLIHRPLCEQVNRNSADPSMSSAAAKEDEAAGRMDDLEAQVRLDSFSLQQQFLVTVPKCMAPVYAMT